MNYSVFILGWVGGMCFGLFFGTVGTLFLLVFYFHIYWDKNIKELFRTSQKISHKLKRALKTSNLPTFMGSDLKNLSKNDDKKDFSFSNNFGDIINIMKQAQKGAKLWTTDD
jgi:hypothetical protein